MNCVSKHFQTPLFQTNNIVPLNFDISYYFTILIMGMEYTTLVKGLSRNHISSRRTVFRISRLFGPLLHP